MCSLQTNLSFIFKGVVSSRINWFAFSSRLFKTFMNGQLLKLFSIFSESLETKATVSKHILACLSLINVMLD